MTIPTRYDTPVILAWVLFLCSACSGPQSDIPVESINLERIEKFDSAVPGFNGLIAQVADLEIDAEKRIYILDSTERHVLVIDSTRTVVNIIGGDGDGPGEIRIFLHSSNHHLAVGGGYIVVGSDPNLIHVFDMEGNFLKRFTPHLRVCDLDVRDDGTIITHTYDSETPIIEYDNQGNTHREYGRAVIRTGMGDTQYPQFNRRNKGTLNLLPGDELITFNSDWIWLGHYRGEELQSETMIDLEELILIAVPTRYNLKLVRPMMKTIRQHNPEIINRAAESRTLNQDDFPGMSTLFSIRTDTVRGETWGFFGMRLWQLTTDGQVLRVFECEEGGSFHFSIRDGYIVFGAGASIAVGNIPSRPN
ncbi:hypothetical protein ACFL6R_05345 [Gemmatimonadota bacterium]